MTLRVGSLFAGIGGFDLGFERAGFEVAWCAEWDRAAQAVLRTRFPRATVYGDIREIDPDALAPVDVICGGFPCQDLSVAGKRAGLAGARSGLFHDAMRIVRRLKPSVLILENVPGLLSSNRGLDFATVLREVGEGWDCAEVGWRLLDSQFFGVAQRRRRVFVVAGSRAGCAESILALAESCGGDPPSRGATREDASADARGRATGDGRCRIECDYGSSVVHAFTGTSHAQYGAGVGTLRANGGDLGGGSETLAVCATGTISHTLRSEGFDASEDGTGRGTPVIAFYPTQDPITSTDGSTHALGCGSRQGCATVAIAIQGNLIGRDSGGPQGVGASESGTMYTLTRADVHGVAFPIQDGERTEKSQNGMGVGSESDPSYTLDTTGSQAVAVCATGTISHTLTGEGCDAGEDGTGRGTPVVAFRKAKRAQTDTDDETWIDDGLANTLNGFDTGDARTTHAIAQGVDLYNGAETGQVAATMTLASGSAGGSGPQVRQGMTVRRLTPTECERLQGFPDGWTQIGTDKPTADSHRYKQLGNAVTVNVAEWIARRVAAWLTK